MQGICWIHECCHRDCYNSIGQMIVAGVIKSLGHFRYESVRPLLGFLDEQRIEPKGVGDE